MSTRLPHVLHRPAPAPDVVLRYGDGPEHVIDLRLPAGPHRGPLVIFLHGGFWKARYDRTHTGPLAADLAGRGHPVASVEYPRVGQPGGGWPGTLDDVELALDALPTLIARHADPAGAVLAGHSAGGQLALLNADRAAGVLALAPVADLALAHRLALGDGAVAALLGGGPDEVPHRYARADPARRGPAPVPVSIVHGEDDDVVPPELARRYAVAAGAGVRLRVLPGAGHFDVIDPVSPAWPAVMSALMRVIDA